MHVDQVAGAGALVQVVDVLSHDQDFAGPAALEFGQGKMRCVRTDVLAQQLAAALVVEALDGRRVAGEGLGGGDVLEAPALPEAALAAEAGQAQFDRDPGTRQHHDRPFAARDPPAPGMHHFRALVAHFCRSEVTLLAQECASSATLRDAISRLQPASMTMI